MTWGGHASIHGYWTRDFKRINPHFIAPDDSTSLTRSRMPHQLVETFHGLGIRLILDIVCNHSSPEINGSKGVVTDDGEPLADFNNDTNGFYHHYGPITDWNDEFQMIHHEMMGLATFNEVQRRIQELHQNCDQGLAGYGLRCPACGCGEAHAAVVLAGVCERSAPRPPRHLHLR